MNKHVKLPIGIDDFKKLRQEGFYYVDKTALIEQLLDNWGEVNLFTRPRRFGKTLNMSMLKAFFEIGADKSLFKSLYIAGNDKLCAEHGELRHRLAQKGRARNNSRPSFHPWL